MKALSANQIELLNGGSLWDFFDGVCAVVGGASVISLLIKTTPAGTYIAAGCGAYGIIRWATS